MGEYSYINWNLGNWWCLLVWTRHIRTSMAQMQNISINCGFKERAMLIVSSTYEDTSVHKLFKSYPELFKQTSPRLMQTQRANTWHLNHWHVSFVNDRQKQVFLILNVIGQWCVDFSWVKTRQVKTVDLIQICTVYILIGKDCKMCKMSSSSIFLFWCSFQ